MVGVCSCFNYSNIISYFLKFSKNSFSGGVCVKGLERVYKTEKNFIFQVTKENAEL